VAYVKVRSMRLREMRNVYKILVGKHQRKNHFEGLRLRDKIIS